ncbi:hypothetical protein N2152v2_010248 [Parachlorella kessleri]
MFRKRAAQLLAQTFRGAGRSWAAAEGSAARTCESPALARAWESPAAFLRDKPSSWQQTRAQWTDRRGYQHFDGRGRYVVVGGTSNRRTYVILGVCGAGSLVVWYSSRQEVPYTGRKHSVLVSSEMEQELGLETFKQVVMEARTSGSLLPAYSPAVRSVERVGRRVARVATDGFGGGFQEHMMDLQWEFAVIRSDQVNAFVVPGGKVVVYTGLLKLLRSEDELAAVLAHECAHVVARHGAERMSQAEYMQFGRLIAYWVLGIAIPPGLLTTAFFLPNSRKAETEADIIGIQLAARACFDPEAAVSVFQKLEEVEKAAGGEAVPKFLRTHPVSSDRIKRIKEMLPKAEYLYEGSGCEAGRGQLDGFKSALGRVVSWE